MENARVLTVDAPSRWPVPTTARRILELIFVEIYIWSDSGRDDQALLQMERARAKVSSQQQMGCVESGT